ncbi:hypothetical protein DH2020_040174 [Rehmannia glutinosa]|uniref:DUF4378 domain-containing protein n=1 Tax=Rehmannia glutinosa TaxID=99300 RepID=A0ABR0UVT9_REHGL
MERIRRRKSKSASGVEGVHQNQKHKAVSRLSSDSRSFIDGSTESDMVFSLDLEQRSRGLATGRVMTKLLAEEMNNSRRRSPSVIARLMVLEGLPSLRHARRQQKRIPDSYRSKTVSINIQPNRQLYGSRSNRRSPMLQQEFKDVLEDLKASHEANRRCSSRWSASSMLTKSEMALIKQKFIDGECLSANETINEKLQDSIELNDTLEMLDSKEGLLMKYIQKPDSLFMNHSAKHEDNTKAWILEKDTAGKHNITFHPKCGDCSLVHQAHISRKSSKVQSEEKKEKNELPMRIVVLRPNLRGMENAGMSGSSTYHSRGYVPNIRQMKENPSAGGSEKLSWRRRVSASDVQFSKPLSKEARKIAREITRRRRDGCDETADARYSGFRGYGGDESSYDAPESDFDSDPEIFNLSSRYSFGGDKKWRRYPSSGSVGWSVNREAKKRLSERWKISHRYKDLEIARKGSTLGEMLAISDEQIRLKHYARTSLGRESTRLGPGNQSATWDGPLGFSSRNGSKDVIHRTSSRSSGTVHRRDTCYDVLAEEKHLMHSDCIRCDRSKVAKKYLSHKEIKKPLPCKDIYINEMDSSSEAYFEIQMEANVKDLSEKQPMFEIAATDDSSGGPLTDVMIAEPGSTTLSTKSSPLHPKQSSVINNNKAAAHDQEDFCLQELHKRPSEEGSPSLPYLGAELASSESSKVADHASPVSILEVPFTEDVSSSSEGYEKARAELNELRMQLQLLKMESEIPIQKDNVANLSWMLSEGNNKSRADGWESSYALDVLIQSGLLEFGFDMFRTKSYSPDCRLDPRLFENLEKKYSDGLRSERRLLFDRLNSALLEIFQQHVDLCPWVRPKLAGLHYSTWRKERVGDALEKLINQESVNGQVPERVLDREMQWLDSKGEIDAIGNEIEELLMDDIITEVDENLYDKRGKKERIIRIRDFRFDQKLQLKSYMGMAMLVDEFISCKTVFT